MRSERIRSKLRMLCAWLLAAILCVPSLGPISLLTVSGIAEDQSTPTSALEQAEVPAINVGSSDESVALDPSILSATEEPVQSPTQEPTQSPTQEPTQSPTQEPTLTPTEETCQLPTKGPAIQPLPSQSETPPVETYPPTLQMMEAYISGLEADEREIAIVCEDSRGEIIPGAPDTMEMGDVSNNVPFLDGYCFQKAIVRDDVVEYICLQDDRFYAKKPPCMGTTKLIWSPFGLSTLRTAPFLHLLRKRKKSL